MGVSLSWVRYLNWFDGRQFILGQISQLIWWASVYPGSDISTDLMGVSLSWVRYLNWFDGRQSILGQISQLIWWASVYPGSDISTDLMGVSLSWVRYLNWFDGRQFILGQHLMCVNRPPIHSDFIWIVQIFFMKFSEIQMPWLKIQIFFGFEVVRNYYIKELFWKSNSDSFLYVQICSHIHSDFVSDQNDRS